MKFKGTSNSGSFQAWGKGFFYVYDDASRVLSIIHARKGKPLIYVDFDHSLSDDAVRYVQLLEKTTQVTALMYSNNATVDLSETLDDSRLAPILTGAAILARYGFDLHERNFERFREWFCRDFMLKDITLQTVQEGYRKGQFVACIETRSGRKICVNADTLHLMLLALSDRVIRDVIPAEFSHSYQDSAHTMLRMTSKLSALSFILNDRFIPARRLSGKNPILQRVFSAVL